MATMHLRSCWRSMRQGHCEKHNVYGHSRRHLQRVSSLHRSPQSWRNAFENHGATGIDSCHKLLHSAAPTRDAAQHKRFVVLMPTCGAIIHAHCRSSARRELERARHHTLRNSLLLSARIHNQHAVRINGHTRRPNDIAQRHACVTSSPARGVQGSCEKTTVIAQDLQRELQPCARLQAS